MYGRESGDRLIDRGGLGTSPIDVMSPPKNAPPSPLASETEDQFAATKGLLREVDALEKRLMPMLRPPGPSTPGENKEAADMPEFLAAMHENTRAVYIGCARLRDILERLVI